MAVSFGPLVVWNELDGPQMGAPKGAHCVRLIERPAAAAARARDI